MRQRYLHLFYVEGNGSFPFDMLRYDQCWPFQESDAAIISKGGPQYKHMVLATIQDRNWTPTKERWASFMWTVSNHSVGRKVD